jgi:superfamily II DNA or RNA helicase
MGAATIRDWFRAQLAAPTNLADASERPGQIGELRLAEFQQVAVARGLKIARSYGGVLLADAVGMGKTRVGLAIAQALRRDARLRGGARPGPVACCVPARLAAQWQQAATRAGIAEIRVVTHTRLSRAGSKHNELIDGARPSVILVDEAHRFRNPGTKRSRALAELATRAPLVLMSATPVCNSQWDLYHLFSLFLADHDLRRAVGHNLREAFELAEAGKFDLSELIEELVIRRVEPPSSVGFGRRPDVSLEILDYVADAPEMWLWQNLEAELGLLSMELFRRDWPRHLLTEYVLKRWESGADALFATLAEMSDFHRRWLEADAHERTLSRKSFRRIFGDEIRAEFGAASTGGFGSRQAVFPFLYDPPDEKTDGDTEADSSAQTSREKVAADLERLENLANRARQVARHGDDKRRAILDLIRQSSQKILIFTSYRHAAIGLYEYLVRRLGPHARVGLVTGSGAQATGLGRTTSDEIVRRFAPRSNGRASLPEHQQIDVLVSTDCLSEGVNLQDCSRVVLADLPYSPLGVEQRIGRLLRSGGPARTATVYLPRPTCWADSLGLRRRLDRKIAQAADSGAAFVAASHLKTPPSQPPEPATPANPLAALTRLDALSNALAAQSQPLELGDFWRAKTRRPPRRLWLRVAIREEHRTRWSWCLARAGHAPEMRLSALVDELICDADGPSPIEPHAPSAQLLQEAQAAVAKREALLRAARLAPYPLRLDAPQRLVWARIWEHIEKDELAVDKEELQRLRHDLLRSFPRGAERQLAQLADARLPPIRLLAQTRTILGDTPRWSPEIRLEIVAGLELAPDE